MQDSMIVFGNMKVSENDGTSYFPAFAEAFKASWKKQTCN